MPGFLSLWTHHEPKMAVHCFACKFQAKWPEKKRQPCPRCGSDDIWEVRLMFKGAWKEMNTYLLRVQNVSE